MVTKFVAESPVSERPVPIATCAAHSIMQGVTYCRKLGMRIALGPEPILVSEYNVGNYGNKDNAIEYLRSRLDTLDLLMSVTIPVEYSAAMLGGVCYGLEALVPGTMLLGASLIAKNRIDKDAVRRFAALQRV